MDPRENILLIRLKSMGDILFTLPVSHTVRENFPDAKIHFLVSKEYAPILRGFADVDEIIPLDRAVYRSGSLSAAVIATFGLLHGLRQKHFSRVIDFQGYSETELLSWWSGAPERWGNAYHRSRGWFYTKAIWNDAGVHPAERYFSLIRRCGLEVGGIRNEYILPEDAGAAAGRFFTAQKLDSRRPTLFIQPFTSAAHKDWPLEKYLAVARHFHARGVQIVFGGGPGERPRLEPAVAAGFVVAAGAPLLVSAGLARLSTAILGGDTGLLHFAVAMGRRVVMLMQTNAPGSSHPFQHADWAVTPAAGNDVPSISTETVIAACEPALNAPACNAFC